MGKTKGSPSGGGTGKKVSNGLVALSSAAVFAVWAVGYHRTSSAADRFAAQAERKAPVPIVSQFVAPAAALPSLQSSVAVPPAPARPLVSERSSLSSSPVPTETPVAAVAEVAEAVAPTSVPPVAVAPVVAPVADPIAASVLATEQRTPEPTTAPVPADVQQSLYKDGTYSGWGSCRHGDIQASVVIEAGRIASAAISQCYTRYPCSWIAHAPGQVVSRQSINVDYVSGATQSVNAFRDAIAEALSKAK